MNDHFVRIEQGLHDLENSDDPAEVLVELTKWFNSLKPVEKSDIFVYTLGRLNGVFEGRS